MNITKKNEIKHQETVNKKTRKRNNWFQKSSKLLFARVLDWRTLKLLEVQLH